MTTFEYLRELKQSDFWEEILEKIREDQNVCAKCNIAVPRFSRDPKEFTLEEWEKEVEIILTTASMSMSAASANS